MSAQLMANIDAVRTAVRTERTARAQGAASRQVHFAAVKAPITYNEQASIE